MKFFFSSVVLLFFWILPNYAQIILTHNVGDTPIDTGMPNCEYEEYWARAFNLADFGVQTNEQFIINSGQVAISNSYEGARIIFNIYAIDSNFPDSSPKRISYGNLVSAPLIGDLPEIVQIDFGVPIVVPAGVERILVEVTQGEDIYNSNYKEVRIAGTEQDTDISWFAGCREYYTHISTANLSTPVNDANFFINVTGEVFSIANSGSTTTLTHNVCDDVRRNDIYSCSWGGVNWGRTFMLQDFGISQDEEYIIESGQIAIGDASWVDVNLQFNIYKIDSNFPTSFSESDLIGSSQSIRIPGVSSSSPRIFTVEFDTPVLVPANVEKILVEVFQLFSSASSAVAFTAGTDQYTGDSWFRSSNGGCGPATFTRTTDLGYPTDNFYINVTGKVNHINNNFEMGITNICSEFLKEFRIENSNNIASIIWDFGDVASGTNNTSSDLSPYHDFSNDGIYTVTATITANDGSIEVISETIDVKEPPNAYGIENVYACENSFNTGISSSFDVSMIEQQVLGGQTDKVVTFIDGSGNKYNSLPNPFTNTIRDIETIIVRVAHKDNLCCYSETTFDLIVNQLPAIENAPEITSCQEDADGYASFDLSNLESTILNGQTGMRLEYYDGNGDPLPNPLPSPYVNSIPNQEIIKVDVIDEVTGCHNETSVTLNVNEVPVAYPLDILIGCDDNNDGISEYFDTSNVENTVLGGQTVMDISYYDGMGNLLTAPLPNPYTNTIQNQEIITVRVTDLNTSCFAETPLGLITSNKPQINTPTDKYGCDYGNGFSTFDLSNIEGEIIGNQTDLNLYYFDSNGNEITDLIQMDYNNEKAWQQTIFVRVENASSNLCFSETSFSLLVNELPQVNIDNSYFLCNLEPSYPLVLNDSFYSWEWAYEDGSIISNNNEVNLIEAGNYSLTVSRLENDVVCENTFEFELIRSILPAIVNIDYQELTDNNFIIVNASGDGDFEYSIDGINYQDSNEFNNILGGVYEVIVRDKFGCGEDLEQITIVDYPKYFTPNNDGNNDYWQIKGIESYSNSDIYIYDRYGKLLKQLSPRSIGWDGTCNGKLLSSDDYWFRVLLEDGREFMNHFTLKR